MKKILVVEDDEVYAEVVSSYLNLEMKDIQCDIAKSGDDAEEWIEHHQCDLIISDIRMPNGSGIELIQWDFNLPATIPIIAISGDTESLEESKQFCEVMGVPYFSKPVNLQELKNTAEAILYSYAYSA